MTEPPVANEYRPVAAFFELEGWEEPYIRERLPNVEVRGTDRRLDLDHVAEATDADVVTVFISSRITADVIGAGSIGLHVIKMARGFGMDVVASDVRPNRLIAEVLGFRYVDLEELLRTSDVISLHLPYSPASHHLLDRARLALVKPGTLLINTVRGALIDTDALLWALDEGILAGAGLDVFEGEDTIFLDGQPTSVVSG